MSISPTYTQQVVINSPQFNSIMLSMIHAPDLNPQMQYGTFIRKKFKHVHVTLSLRKIRQQVSR